MTLVLVLGVKLFGIRQLCLTVAVITTQYIVSNRFNNREESKTTTLSTIDAQVNQNSSFVRRRHQSRRPYAESAAQDSFISFYTSNEDASLIPTIK